MSSRLVVPVQLPNGRPYGALIGLSRELPPPDVARMPSSLPVLIANMLGALAGAEAAGRLALDADSSDRGVARRPDRHRDTGRHGSHN